MFKKLVKRISSVILALTFVMAYLSFMPDKALAYDFVDTDLYTGVVYTACDGFRGIFTPKVSGYYLLESNGYVPVVLGLGDNARWQEELTIIPFELEQKIACESENLYRGVFYLESGKTYYTEANDGQQLVWRKIDKYFIVDADSDHQLVSMEKDITVKLSTYSNVTVSNVTYFWLAGKNSSQFKTNQITVNPRDLLNDDGEFLNGSPDSNDCGSEYGDTWIDCKITVTYNNKEYTIWKSVFLSVFETELSKNSSVVVAGNSYSYCINYHDCYEFDYPFFEVLASSSADTIINYQWYKTDVTNWRANGCPDDNTYLKPLSGETTNSLSMSQSLYNALGEPYLIDNGENAFMYHRIMCIVTFRNGNQTATRRLEFWLNYMTQYNVLSDGIVRTTRGNTITLPKDAPRVEDGETFIGEFYETDLPSGLEYRYRWYNCGAIPDTWGESSIGDANNVNMFEDLRELTYLGTGKEFKINTDRLTMYEIDGGRYSYVACYIEPVYKSSGKRCYNNEFMAGYYVFEIRYSTLRLISYTDSIETYVGDMSDIMVEAEGVGLKYQWQYLDTKTNTWKNSNAGSAKSSVLKFKIAESHDGQQYRCVITDVNNNTVISGPCTITIMNEFSIFKEPENVSGQLGDLVNISAGATGKGLTYQWQYLGTDGKWKNSSANSAKSATLSFKLGDTHNGQQYRCVVKNNEGKTLESKPATITILAPTLEIKYQPSDVTGNVGDTVNFYVGATGSGLKYQWQYYNGTKWVNSNANTAKTKNLTFKLSEAQDGQEYHCVVTDVTGKTITSSAAKVTIKNLFAITSQPSDVSGKVGDTVKFTVGAKGTGLTYQWQYYANGRWNNSNAGTAKNASLSFKLAESHNGQQYRCVVKDFTGKTLESNSAKITIGNALKISGQPADVTGKIGDSVKFTVIASGTGLTYQWQYLGNDGLWKNSKAGTAKTATLCFNLSESHNGQQYRCVVKDASGNTVESNTAKITLGETPAVAITSQPTNVYAVVGGSVKFTVAASGTGLKYQWQFKAPTGDWKNSNAGTAKSATLTFKVTEANNGYQYRCIVTDASGNTATSTSGWIKIVDQLPANSVASAEPAEVPAEDVVIDEVSVEVSAETVVAETSEEVSEIEVPVEETVVEVVEDVTITA